MNESIFDEILGTAVNSEFAEFENTPEHKFSLKHRLAMSRIFARFEKNVQKLKEKNIEPSVPTEPTEHRRKRLTVAQRLTIALIIVFLLALTGCVVAAFFSKDFNGTVYKDNTLLFPVNLENAPQSIEYIYAFDYVPDEFELVETIPSVSNVYTSYENKTTKQTIVLYQWVKSHYNPRINTEYHALEEIEINGKEGLYINAGNNEDSRTFLIWDNDDYIIQISSGLNKEDALELSKLHKIENK